MVQTEKNINIIAGPNGAGKTTFVESYLDRYVECDEFLNADMIAKGLSPFAPQRQNVKASALFLERMTELEQGQCSFALETTLSGLSYRRRIGHWQDSGFTVNLFFIWLPSQEIAVRRVAGRVLQGGHDIPETDIRRRFDRGWKNLFLIYLNLVDNAWILDGSNTPPRPVWYRSAGDETIRDTAVWNTIRQFPGAEK